MEAEEQSRHRSVKIAALVIMNRRIFKYLFVSIMIAVALLAGCKFGSRSSGTGEELGSEADREEAFHLIEDANENIKSIKVLYRNNNQKVDQLEAALKAGDLKKVKELADELSLAINDGYLFADSIIDKLEKAQGLDINPTWKRYLSLKQESLELQIRAFDYRRNSAVLFRDKAGSDDPATLKLARDTFKSNEENFKKYMADAEKVSKEADELRKASLNPKKR
jgi:hypothetical protein